MAASLWVGMLAIMGTLLMQSDHSFKTAHSRKSNPCGCPHPVPTAMSGTHASPNPHANRMRERLLRLTDPPLHGVLRSGSGGALLLRGLPRRGQHPTLILTRRREGAQEGAHRVRLSRLASLPRAASGA